MTFRLTYPSLIDTIHKEYCRTGKYVENEILQEGRGGPVRDVDILERGFSLRTWELGVIRNVYCTYVHVNLVPDSVWYKQLKTNKKPRTMIKNIFLNVKDYKAKVTE